MGHVATPEVLAVRWAEVMRDPSLRDLPYKIELNERGKIEISPASNRHALLQAHLAAEFAKHLPGGRPLTECSVLTEIGIRVPDVAWASAEFLRAHAASTPFPRAPEVCVEIVSPSNSDDEIEEKTRAYLARWSARGVDGQRRRIDRLPSLGRPAAGQCLRHPHLDAGLERKGDAVRALPGLSCRGRAHRQPLS